MPIKESAKKYVRVTTKKTEKNRKIKGQFKSALKITREALAKNNLKKAQEYLKRFIKAIDKATQKKVLHRNTASRMKSKLNKSVKEATKK